MKKIEFFRHNIGKKEIKAVNKVLNSVFLTTGKVTEEFEVKFAQYLDVKRVVGVTSATAGLLLLLKELGIKEGDEIITTPLSFVATTNIVLHCNAKVVFSDVDKSTGNIDLEQIEDKITDRTAAIIPVHLYGVMADIKKIKNIADKYNLRIIEDSAHCIEGEIDHIKAGQISDGAAFSFYATKNITSGEGGAIAVNNEDLADKIKILRLHGLSADAAGRYTNKFAQYDVPMPGYKYNMFDIQAALLLGQLERIDELWKRKKDIFDLYCNELKDIPGLRLPSVPENVRHSLHLFTIWVKPEKRDEIIIKLQENHIGVAVNFKPIHLFTYYKEKFGFKEGMFPEAERIGASTISLPFYAKLKNKEVEYITGTLKNIMKQS